MTFAEEGSTAVLSAHIGRDGARLSVELALTAYEAHRRQAGLVQLPLTFPKRGDGLVDTGSEVSVISDEAAEALELETLRRVPVVTIHGEEPGEVCVVQVTLGPDQRPRPRPVEVHAIRRPLRAVQLLIGRDILRHGHLIWNGPQAAATLRFPAPAG